MHQDLARHELIDRHVLIERHGPPGPWFEWTQRKPDLAHDLEGHVQRLESVFPGAVGKLEPDLEAGPSIPIVCTHLSDWNHPRSAQVPKLVLDFGPLHRREVSIQDLAGGLDRSQLAVLTNEMCDLQLASIKDALDEDVAFVPEDPEANDTFAARPEDVGLSWTLGHVVVHTTASSEESAALALVLARGLAVEGRSRYEVPWEDARTVAFIRHRIVESRRMRLALLDAWPDEPHLDNFYSTAEGRPPMNALGRFLSGLSHDDSHLAQMHKIMGQVRERRNAR